MLLWCVTDIALPALSVLSFLEIPACHRVGGTVHHSSWFASHLVYATEMLP